MSPKKMLTMLMMLFMLLSLVGPKQTASANGDPPNIRVVNLPTGEFHVESWPVGRWVTATVDNPATAQIPDYKLGPVQTVDDNCPSNHPACAFFYLPNGAQFQPYWTVTVTDGEITSTITIHNIQVISVNLLTNIVTGTIDPVDLTPEQLSVLYMGPGDCDNAVVTIDAQGNWVGNFTGICDLVVGSGGALNYDAPDGSIQIGSWNAPSQALTLTGFYQPVDMNGVYNVVKGGSSAPLKFEIFDGSMELTNVLNVNSLTTVQIVCNTSANNDEIEMTVTGETSLRYDSSAGQFIYNWKTPKSPGACYRVTMTAGDGSSLSAFFNLK